MAFVLDFDPEHRVLRVTVSAEFTDSQLKAAFSAVARFIETEGFCLGLVDYSQVTSFNVSTSVVRALAEAPSAFPPSALRVNVAPQPAIYGAVRMFQIIGDGHREGLHVVRTLEEAHELLGFKELNFSQRVEPGTPKSISEQ